MKCNTCDYFDKSPHTTGRVNGKCRINPPRLGHHGQFPNVKGEEDWCGQHSDNYNVISGTQETIIHIPMNTENVQG